ncbi:unnamed protein product [Cylindrotheca closterium]|uniref:Uncharacterized protein n=1 Tax=Cylindrotheca closterium TaxID=2856 RepID=A0AAD2GAI8_9STRA|nr:unnamed protein product [Cylindrotheca closterium]
MSKSQHKTTDHTNSLEKAKTAINTIKERLQPVVDKVNDHDFGVYSAQAHATVALSIGMLKYMAARLQGKDRGRKADDPLRAELNNMKRILAEVKKKTTEKVKKTDDSTAQKTTEQTKPDSESEKGKSTAPSSNVDSSIAEKKKAEEVKTKKDKKRKSSDFNERGRSKSPKSRKKR